MPRFTRRSTLSRRDRVVVRAIAEAMFSEDGEVDRARLDAHVSEVDAFISAASKTTRVAMRLALLLVRLSPVLFLFRFTTLERLALGERVVLLSRLERSLRSSVSLAFIGWRSLMTLIFYEDASELRRLGYGEERQRYKRALPLVAGADAPLPVPLESGVRIRDDAPSTPTTPATGEQEVA